MSPREKSRMAQIASEVKRQCRSVNAASAETPPSEKQFAIGLR